MTGFEMAMLAIESLMDNSKEFESWWAGISMDERINLMQAVGKKFFEEGLSL